MTRHFMLFAWMHNQFFCLQPMFGTLYQRYVGTLHTAPTLSELGSPLITGHYRALLRTCRF